ncbi:unnamed protein product [Effrenium voratum]|uniref:Uncharacterized protein n=1 Tax=Effrenium voratum TaxID=2562239 RepID=A0AA36HZ16_9DINO|nr:unnamed protein product [Effrenium voratum]
MSFKVPPHFLQVAVLALALSLEVLLPPVLTEEIGLEDVEARSPQTLQLHGPFLFCILAERPSGTWCKAL